MSGLSRRVLLKPGGSETAARTAAADHADRITAYMVPQQTGVPFIIRQQVQPPLRQEVMQSQQPWIMSEHFWSPLVQVTVQPSLVMSHLHMPMVRLQQQTVIPFIMQQTLHMPPASIWQRFCIIVQAVVSVQTQVIFIPPWTFSTFIVQRGTMTMLGVMVPAPGMVVPMPGVPMVGIPIMLRSIIIVLVMI